MQLCGSPVSRLSRMRPRTVLRRPAAAFATAQREVTAPDPNAHSTGPSNSSNSFPIAAVLMPQYPDPRASGSQPASARRHSHGLKARFSSRRYQAPGRRPGMRSVRLWSQLSRQSSVVRARNRVRPAHARQVRDRAPRSGAPGTAARRSRPPGRIVPAFAGRHGTLRQP